MVTKMDLLYAVETEPLEKIMKIFSMEDVLKRKTWLDYEALNKTLELGRKDVAEFLLSSNCRVNRSDREVFGTNTPLHHAVILKDVDLVKKILKQNGSVSIKNADGDTPLHLAFLNLSEEIVNVIFSHMLESIKFETIVNPKNRHGYSHMHIACIRDEVELVKLYLDSGEDVNHAIDKHSPTNAGYTSLHFAVRIGCISTIKLLLSRGADPFKEDANYLSAYGLNEDRKIEYSMIQYLLNQKNEKCVSAFHIACAEGNLECIQRFLEMGFEVNKALSDKLPFCPKHTPLHFAVESGQPKCVKLLLRHGANVTACNAQNMTPLHLALYNEKPNNSLKDHSILKMLYSALKDPFVEMTDSNGLTYFHVAVAQNNVELVRQYLECLRYQVNGRVLRNPRNFSNFTPLHFGAMYGCLEVVELLLERKADANCNDDYLHGTPLHMAMERGDLAMANLLLDHGASVGAARPKDRRTPLHLLLLHIFNRSDECSTEDLEGKAFVFEPLVKRLVSLLDCDLNAKDADGNTALHIVCSKTRISLFYLDTLISCGANVNLENNNGDTPFDVVFSDDYVYSTDDCMLLYHHVQDLKALNVWINPRNIACCKRLLKEKNECDSQAECLEQHMQYAQSSRLAEIERLKATKLHMKTSLYNVISDTQDQLEKRACSNHLKSILDSLEPILKEEDFDVKFPRYGYMVRLWYNSARSYEPARDTSKSPGASGVARRSFKNSRRSVTNSKKSQIKRRRTK